MEKTYARNMDSFMILRNLNIIHFCHGCILLDLNKSMMHIDTRHF